MKTLWMFLFACGAVCAQSTTILTCSGSPQQCDGTSAVQSASVLDFGYVSDASTASVKFTVTNNSQSALSVVLQAAGTFSSDPSAPVPASVPASGSTTFTIDFSPTQTGLSQTTLTAGSESFTLEGTGMDSTPGGATPLKFQNCNTDCASSTPLFTPWNFPETPEGEENYLTLRPVNPTNSTVKLITYTLTCPVPGCSDIQSFALTNDYVDEEITPQQTGTPFLVHFTPQKSGALSAILTAIYCVPDSSGNCGTTSLTEPVVQLQGNGIAPQVTLSCKGSPQQCNGNWLTPASILDFGNVTVGTTSAIQFTVKNNSQAGVNVTLQTPMYISSPFLSDKSAPVPAMVAAGATATFTVDFSPGEAALGQAAIVVGASSFPLQGNGVTSSADDLSSLVVSYTDSTGVRQTAQGVIDFGQVVSGASKTFNVSVCNPYTSYGTVSIPVPTISGSGFTLAGLPSGPVAIPPASSPTDCNTGAGPVSFQLAFTASETVGNASGTLTIGTRTIALTAQRVAAPLPAASFQLSQQPLASDQQVSLTVQLASPSQGEHRPTITMAFVPLVQNASPDPGIKFLANNQTQLNLDIAAGSQTATYNGQSGIAFQTGTTAGKLTLTLTDAGTQITTQSFDIPQEKVQIASATATLSSPNIVITINGYDNTYNVGELSFTFYDTKGNIIAPGAISVDASSQFHQYFFTNDPAGGAFALQATFPVYGGDASGVGSVSVTLTNSAGSTTTSATLQ